MIVHLWPRRGPVPEHIDHDVVPVDYGRAAIRIRATSKIERRRRMTACAMEPWTVAWLEREVVPGDVVYDIGANVGVFSLIAAHLLTQRGRVVAFEPGYANYARLCENLLLNGEGALILPVPLPLSDESCIGSFRYRSLEPGQSRHRLELSPPELGIEGGEGLRHDVIIARLDGLIETFDLPAPTLVKIDVDGAELHVLRGAEATFRSPALRSALIEVDRPLWSEVESFFLEHGFALAELHERRHASKNVYAVFARS